MNDRRFGDVAVDLGFVSRDAIDHALSVQAERKDAGRPPKLIGQILIEEGRMTPEQVEAVVDVLYPAAG